MRPAVGIPQDAPVATLLQVRGFPVPVTVVTTDAEHRAFDLLDVELAQCFGVGGVGDGGVGKQRRMLAHQPLIRIDT